MGLDGNMIFGYQPDMGKAVIAPGDLPMKAGDSASNLDFMRRSATNRAKYGEYLKIVNGLVPALRRAGVTDDFILAQMIYQVLFESANLTSPLSQDDSNFSGIMYVGQPGATASIKHKPYAKYANSDAWASDYVRILSGGKQPIKASSLSDFVSRLKANGYFTAPITSYYNGLASKAAYYKDLIQWYNAHKKQIDLFEGKEGQATKYEPATHEFGPNDQAIKPGTGSDYNHWFMSNWKWLLGGAAGVIVIVAIAKRR